MLISVKGRVIFAATGGTAFNPDLPTIVFIHGAALDHSCWPLQSRWFAWHGYGVLAIDLPGHGRSPGPALSSIDEMADCVVDLLREAGCKRPVMVGHSMGAAVALEVAARLGDDAGKLALLGVSEAIPVHPALLADALERPEQACLSMTAWGHGPAGHVGGNRA
ncbi:MAG: alpha/beta fold hydrolase, partial [Rhodospirillales bacterium]